MILTSDTLQNCHLLPIFFNTSRINNMYIENEGDFDGGSMSNKIN